MIKYMAVAFAVAGAVSGGGAVAVAVPVAGLTKRFFNQKDFLINVWGYAASHNKISRTACTYEHPRDSSTGPNCAAFTRIQPPQMTKMYIVLRYMNP